nr:hypothetical protein [uncultured Rhodopila sp.]
MATDSIHDALPVPPIPPTSDAAVASAHLAFSNPDVTLWINLALSAATLVVTGVGVVIAISAFVGYQAARRMLKREAQKHARKASLEHLESPEFKASLQAVANDLVRDHIRNNVVLTLSNAPPQPRTEMT